MAYDVAETDDDAARMRLCELKLLGLTVDKLRGLRAHLTPNEWRLVARLDTQINVMRGLPSADDLKRLKAMAWTHRRLMPATIAPKLPPHDPIVQEMGL
jgi:hypothetical protein